MLENKNYLRKLMLTVTELLVGQKETEIVNILNDSEISCEEVHYDNWNGGTTYYSINIITNVEQFIKILPIQDVIEDKIKQNLELILRTLENEKISSICIIPQSTQQIQWDKIINLYSKDEFVSEINYLKDIMIAVATGSKMIQDVNNEYQKKYLKFNEAMRSLGLENPNPYSQLWQWYGKWSSGELPQYKDRRTFIGKMFEKLLKLTMESQQSELLNISVNLNGWDRIERSVREIKFRISQAQVEEQFQAVGLLCRDTIISLAQEVYNPEKHKILDNIDVSRTDAKRMLDAYFSSEIPGKTNENLRRYARSSNDLANDLTHRRTATVKEASICVSATISLVNLIGILENRQM
ncbi:hypothetical protein [Flavobacterium sp. xlx-221]|uniref:hypothetical protein n=1 Tax=Flavobacterium sp. xlx-221 TaxID=2758675 RepID=UPI0015F3CE4C|nr:hypothetical protein [Flavobacterium sp. xlx-221]MBA5791536.1 hypothetical protein [Flavobacterium sp. xlx-221]